MEKGFNFVEITISYYELQEIDSSYFAESIAKFYILKLHHHNFCFSKVTNEFILITTAVITFNSTPGIKLCPFVMSSFI